MSKVTPKWMKTYQNLKQWSIDNNGILPSRNSEDAKVRALAEFVKYVRDEYKKDLLSEEQIGLLLEIPNWYWSKKDLLKENAKKIDKFYKENGFLPRKNSSDQYEKTLAVWISYQRDLYKKGKLSNDEIAILNKIEGWWWDLDDLWMINLNKLKKIVGTINKLPSKKSDNNDHVEAALWIARQRKAYRDGKLEEKRKTLLDGVPYLTL